MSDHKFQLTNGLSLGYAEYGDPQGEVVMYHHGWPSARVQGELMHEVALKYKLRIIAPDRPGIGLSDFQPGRTLQDWPVTLAELAAQVGAAKFHLLAWSGGGPYALTAAKVMPERLLSVTICCGAPPLMFLGYQHMFWVYRFMIRLRAYAPWLLALVLRLGKVIASGDPTRLPLRWMLRMLGPADRKVLSDARIFSLVRAGMVEALRRGPKHVIADADIYLCEWGFEVSQIDTLVHFWHGKEDRNISWKYSEQIAALMPMATTHWFDHEGHYSLPITRLEEMVKLALNQTDEVLPSSQFRV